MKQQINFHCLEFDFTYASLHLWQPQSWVGLWYTLEEKKVKNLVKKVKR